MPSDDFVCCSDAQWVTVQFVGSAGSAADGRFDVTLGKCSACGKDWMKVLPSSGTYPPMYTTIAEEYLTRLRAIPSYADARREALLREWLDQD